MGRSFKGFTLVEAIVIIAVAGIITTVGLTFYNSVINNQSATGDETSQATTVQSQQVPVINSSADIDAATTDLDALDVEDIDDTSQLDEQQAAF